ncbi:bifunctional 3-dehydroquinate dehydratase/shikimate dehydrogenase, chloroplastic-like [Humulus lupulus]|uniref:bifunctional 3-dehydroquinate dehydratase/shikimate dehydrogenase, chloroplastic-like n=1 Tax=Humulus lupulus TaxID=3486 RepID=UPI002B40137E|nr:bifunctional 3-dehydroquinate dehydratase/shikimate dehydrogenase, chloroplastic-like [Humulus lupulus]
MAICNTIIPVQSKSGAIMYKAQSQDEDALVQAVAQFHMVFFNKSGNILGTLGVIECPVPDKDIRRFDANLRLFPPFIDNDLCPLTIKNTILQSCYLRNTEWACGVAVYTVFACYLCVKVAHEFIQSIAGKKPENFKIVVSSHNYQNTPSMEDLGNLVAKIQATGADIVKFGTSALDITDAARVFQITVHSQEIFCSNNSTGYELLHLYNFRQIGPDTKGFGVIGKPVGQSKSPILYNEAFKSVGFNGVYLHLLVDDIANFLQTYLSADFAGFSVTIPHKEAALTCCDEVDPVAKSIGAVNCIIRRQSDGKLLGFNTDYIGAISSIEDGLRGSLNASSMTGSPLAGKLFVVIGAGGAGKALACGAKEKGARVVIANRTYGSLLSLLSFLLLFFN